MQTQIIATGDPVTSVSLQKIFSSLSDPGILAGNQLTAVSATIVGITAGTAMTDSGVFIIEDELKELVFTLTVSPQNYTVYYQYIPSNNFGGNPAALQITTGLLDAKTFTNGVVIGWIQYPGGSVPLNAESMFISAPRFRLGEPLGYGINSYVNQYAPFDSKWTQYAASGPLSQVTTQYNSTYKAPITTLQNVTSFPLSNTTWLLPFTVPDLGVGRIQVEMQVDSGALATITVIDVAGNEITPVTNNFFTNTAMTKNVMTLPLSSGLSPGDEMFIKLVFSIQPTNAVRLKSMGISSFSEPFSA